MDEEFEEWLDSAEREDDEKGDTSLLILSSNLVIQTALLNRRLVNSVYAEGDMDKIDNKIEDVAILIIRLYWKLERIR